MRQQKIKDAGKLNFAAALIGDVAFMWTGNSKWETDQVQHRIQLGAEHEISTLLLLQIIHEIVHAGDVADMVVDLMTSKVG